MNDDQAAITILSKKLKEYEAKMKTDRETYRQKRKAANSGEKKSKDLQKQSDEKTKEAKVLSRRELMEYYGFDLDY